MEGHKITVFWRKYNELCDERGIKPRALATELGISAATVTKWVNDGMPHLDMITRIAEYFDVPIEYLINENDTPIIPKANKKRSVLKSVSSLPQRWVSLRRGSEIILETQLKIIPYVLLLLFKNNLISNLLKQRLHPKAQPSALKYKPYTQTQLLVPYL